MMTLASPWASPAVQAVAWALLHFVWQGALAGLLTASLLRALRRASSSVRYTVAVTALFALLVVPAGTALRLAGSQASSQGGDSFTHGAGSIGPLAGAVVPRPIEATRPPSAAPSLLRSLPARVAPALPWIVALWGAGVALLGLYNVGGWWQSRRLARRGRPLDGDPAARLAKLSRRLGLARAVRLLESASVPVPTVIGWLRPAILVPASALVGLSTWQLEAILAHELAHVRRHDYLVNLLQAAVETVLFYHPVVWWLSAEVRKERENCCDDMAVAVCGDRIGYARALADLEVLRLPQPALALAANGGSLVDRVRRLVGAPAARPAQRSLGSLREGRSGLAGLLAAGLMLGGVATLWPSKAGAAPEAVRPAAGQPTSSSLPQRVAMKVAAFTAGPSAKEPSPTPAHRYGGAMTSQEGTWKAEREGDRVQLESSMSWDGGRHRWQNGETYPASQLVGLTAGPKVRFELRRDAGRFVYEGTFRGDRGSGSFHFEPDPAYQREMASLGYTVTDDRVMEMAIHDVALAFVREIHALGYKDSSLDTLVAFRIHDVSPQLIKEFAALGLRSVPADDLVQLRIHDVSPEFIRGLGATGYRDLSADTLVQFKIHDVSVEQIRGLENAGIHSMSADDLVQLQIHGVRAETVRALKEAGLKDLAVDQLVQLNIHDVTPTYVRSLTQAGLRDLSPDELVQLHIHGVDGNFVRKALSHDNRATVDDIVGWKIRGRLDR